MWIEPNGKVKILHNIDLDNLYDNTIFFDSRQSQYNYFNSKVKYTYNKISYQRLERHYMRVEINAENLYDCNYLMYQNTSFGDRWFYAFITGVEYLSNMVTRIEFEIDEMQTWFWDCTMGESFVEREHSYTDYIGDNRVDEGLETGEYIINSIEQSGEFDDNVIIVATNVHIEQQALKENNMLLYDGMPTALLYNFWFTDRNQMFEINSAGINECISFINFLIGNNRADSIIDVFIVPKKFVEDITSYLPTSQYVPRTFNHAITRQTTLNGYTPRNKKLLQEPYNILTVADMRTNVGEYYYEDFTPLTSNDITFEYSLGLSCDTSMMITPLNYKGANKNVNEKLVYKGYPHASWNTDMWKAYIAQNGGILPTMIEHFNGTAKGVMDSALTTMGVGKVFESPEVAKLSGAMKLSNTVNNVKQSLVNLGKKSIQPPSANGNFNGDVIYANGCHDFFYIKQTIRYNMAERIDEYFDMYGYATKRVKIPNISSRPEWNYIQTINANIFGNIPADSLKKIKEIFDKGITFWKNGEHIGNYSLPNPAHNVEPV